MLIALASKLQHFRIGLAGCSGFFWLLDVAVILRGIETIRSLQGVSVPFLLLIGVVLPSGERKGGRLRSYVATPPKFHSFGEFFRLSFLG